LFIIIINYNLLNWISIFIDDDDDDDRSWDITDMMMMMMMISITAPPPIHRAGSGGSGAFVGIMFWRGGWRGRWPWRGECKEVWRVEERGGISKCVQRGGVGGIGTSLPSIIIIVVVVVAAAVVVVVVVVGYILVRLCALIGIASCGCALRLLLRGVWDGVVYFTNVSLDGF
jgi:hypothetical protein